MYIVHLPLPVYCVVQRGKRGVALIQQPMKNDSYLSVLYRLCMQSHFHFKERGGRDLR